MCEYVKSMTVICWDRSSETVIWRSFYAIRLQIDIVIIECWKETISEQKPRHQPKIHKWNETEHSFRNENIGLKVEKLTSYGRSQINSIYAYFRSRWCCYCCFGSLFLILFPKLIDTMAEWNVVWVFFKTEINDSNQYVIYKIGILLQNTFQNRICHFSYTLNLISCRLFEITEIHTIFIIRIHFVIYLIFCNFLFCSIYCFHHKIC